MMDPEEIQNILASRLDTELSKRYSRQMHVNYLHGYVAAIKDVYFALFSGPIHTVEPQKWNDEHPHAVLSIDSIISNQSPEEDE